MTDSDDIDGLERRLDELTEASRERAAELRAIVEAMPEVTSRRAQLRSIVLSVLRAPDMPLRSRQFVLRVATDQSKRARDAAVRAGERVRGIPSS